MIGGIVAIGAQVITDDQAAVDNCTQQRNQAVVLAEKFNAWTALPEDSPSEDQCAINDWVVDVTGIEPTEPEGE